MIKIIAVEENKEFFYMHINMYCGLAYMSRLKVGQPSSMSLTSHLEIGLP